MDRATTTTAIKEYIPAWRNIVKRKIFKTLKYVNIYHVEPTGVTVHNFENRCVVLTTKLQLW